MSIVADLGMVIKPPPSGGLGRGLQYAAFYTPKGRLLHAEKPPFATRKTAFCNPLDARPLRSRPHAWRKYAPIRACVDGEIM